MEFYNLTQSGTEVQRLLDFMEVLDVDIDTIEKRIDDIPVINIDTDKLFDISSNINDTGIYYIKSTNINTSTIKPDNLPINSEYSFIIHLQSYDQNNLNHSSQYLITQDDNRNIVVYKRNTENEDSWTEFVDINKEIVDYIEKRIDQSYSETDTPKSTNAQSGIAVVQAVNKAKDYTNEKIGDIGTAIDSIIDIQNSFINNNPAGGTTNIIVDSGFSETSTNPVQNKVITVALKNISSALSAIVDGRV